MNTLNGKNSALPFLRLATSYSPILVMQLLCDLTLVCVEPDTIGNLSHGQLVM
jgi:hypothetical protein